MRPLQRRLLDVDETIRDTPANGLAGIGVKLRLARTCIRESHQGKAMNEERDVADIADSWEGQIALSALADVERLYAKRGSRMTRRHPSGMAPAADAALLELEAEWLSLLARIPEIAKRKTRFRGNCFQMPRSWRFGRSKDIVECHLCHADR